MKPFWQIPKRRKISGLRAATSFYLRNAKIFPLNARQAKA